jgi:hypothetical protein
MQKRNKSRFLLSRGKLLSNKLCKKNTAIGSNLLCAMPRNGLCGNQPQTFFLNQPEFYRLLNLCALVHEVDRCNSSAFLLALLAENFVLEHKEFLDHAKGEEDLLQL